MWRIFPFGHRPVPKTHGTGHARTFAGTMGRMEAPNETPEGRLLESARDQAGLSQNEAARQAGMSGTHWRTIVKGGASTMRSRRGVATLARMAEVVGVGADDFDEIGRHDIAAQLGDGDAEELLDDMERTLTRVEKMIEAHADDRERPSGLAAINLVRTILEKSTTKRPDR